MFSLFSSVREFGGKGEKMEGIKRRKFWGVCFYSKSIIQKLYWKMILKGFGGFEQIIQIILILL